MDDKQHIEKLKQQGWDDMSSLLDEHMPEKTDRGIVWWYWLTGAAAVILAVTLQWFLLQDSDSPGVPGLSSPDQMIALDNGPSTAGEDEIIKKSVQKSPGLDAGTKTQDIDQPAPAKDSPTKPFHGINQKPKTVIEQQKNTFLSARAQRASNATDQGIAESRTKPEYSHNASEGLAISETTERGQLAQYLEMPSFLISNDIRSISINSISSSTEKISLDQRGQFTGLIFSDAMWSLSDAFGFVNAGPGLQYSKGKWRVGFSAGVSVPLPDQKAFTSSNVDFSNQYNFNNSHDSKVEVSSPGFGTSNSVYYERYSMKPGWMANITLHYRVAKRWSVLTDLGRIGFRYDFVRKAEPNSNLAASTDLSNLRNNIWYGGLSISYLLGDRWQLYAGGRMINLLDADAEGILPVLRLEFAF